MMMTCPTCGKKIPYDKGNPWRPFCCERCKMIDLGHWAAGDYQIQGAPGSADPEFIEQELERMRREALEKPKD